MLRNDNDITRCRRRVEQLAAHIEDIACAQDQMTKALITIHRDVKTIADKLNITLPKPLIDMNLEKGDLNKNDYNTVDAEIINRGG